MFKEEYVFLLDLEMGKSKRKSIKELSEIFFTTKPLLTGFNDIDNEIKGIKNGNLYVLASLMNDGKVSFINNLITNILNSYNQKIVYFNARNKEEQILEKLIAIKTNISINKVHEQNFDDCEKKKVKNILTKFSSKDLNFYDTSKLSEVIGMIDREKPDLVILDPIQYFIDDLNNPITRNQEIENIISRLKEEAVTINIPIIILSNLSKKLKCKKINDFSIDDLIEAGISKDKVDVALFFKINENKNEECLSILIDNKAKVSDKKILRYKIDTRTLKIEEYKR